MKPKVAYAERKEAGHPLGLHRVLDKEARLPQAAERLDNSLPIYSNEILIRVERLNVDAASFVQMEEETLKHEGKISKIIIENSRARGKQQNRVTGSGGMLMGEIIQIGSALKKKSGFKVGDRIATLVSLSLTPLHIEKITKVSLATHQVDVEGHAILFERTIAAKLPKDLPEQVALAVYDVAGAPAAVNGLAKPGNTLVVIGAGGKAGLLACVAGRRKIGKKGKLIAIEPFAKAAQELRDLGLCNEVLEIDATNPTLVQSSVDKATRGKMGDIVVNVASVSNTELSSILSAKAKGKVLFFSMATSFPRVTLGAEGIVSDATLLFGNGYYPGHAEFAINLIRKNKSLLGLFSKRYLKA